VLQSVFDAPGTRTHVAAAVTLASMPLAEARAAAQRIRTTHPDPRVRAAIDRMTGRVDAH